MSLPTTGEKFAELIEHIRRAQEAAAYLAHLEADNNSPLARGWLGVSEMFKMVQYQVTRLAMRKMQ